VPNQIHNASGHFQRTRKQVNGIAVNGDLPNDKQHSNERRRLKPDK
jgi:hypothetical protein